MELKLLKLALVAIGLVFSTGVNSAFITENFTVEALQGDFIGTTGTGSFTYNDTSIIGTGSESITSSDGLTLALNVFGQDFTESDDVDAPNYPVLEFLDGSVVALDFVVVDESVCTSCINIIQDNVFEFGFYELSPAIGGGFEGELFVNTVPVPAAVWLFGSGLLGLIGIARRNKA